MLKIVLTGPESSGKTTLAQELAEHHGTVWVPEFARSYLDKLDRPYQQRDLLEIAKGQVALEDEMALNAGDFLFLDTSLEVIKIWSQVRFGNCHPWILGQLFQRRHDLYLLCQPDLPWVPDPQRENPNDRDVLYEIYRKELISMEATIVEISGAGEHRFHLSLAALENHFQ